MLSAWGCEEHNTTGQSGSPADGPGRSMTLGFVPSDPQLKSVAELRVRTRAEPFQASSCTHGKGQLCCANCAFANAHLQRFSCAECHSNPQLKLGVCFLASFPSHFSFAAHEHCTGVCVCRPHLEATQSQVIKTCRAHAAHAQQQASNRCMLTPCTMPLLRQSMAASLEWRIAWRCSMLQGPKLPPMRV